MEPIIVTRKNLASIDFGSIVAFEYSEPGAMGFDIGTLSFSTADGTYFRLDYTRGEIKLGEFVRVLHAGAFTMAPIPPMIWHQFYLGAGNHFVVHNIVLNKLLKDSESDPEHLYMRWQMSLGTPLLSKQERYCWLVEKARSSYPVEGSDAPLTWCDSCSEEISLWTYWQGRGCLAPEILVVGQDWGCPASKEGKSALKNIGQGSPYLEDNVFPSDVNLAYLFRKTFGIDLNHQNTNLFFTNLLLGYRTDSNSGALNVPLQQDLPFFKELMNILTPKVVICLGKETFENAVGAFGIPLPYSGPFNKALEAKKTFVDIAGTRFFGMAHCGTLGCLNRTGNRKGATPEVGREMQVEDWQQIKDYMRGA